jgi:hypothetical protein
MDIENMTIENKAICADRSCTDKSHGHSWMRGSIESTIALLKKADKAIKKRHRYQCGLEEGEDVKEERATFFFLSPDYQNGELYHELVKLGFSRGGYNAPYYWRVVKDGVMIQYTEGDIYLTLIK